MNQTEPKEIKEEKNKGGRPQREFSPKEWRDFERLCSLQCTKLEICDWFNLDDCTLDKLVELKYNLSFSEVFAQKRGKGKVSLRRNQFKLSQSNPAMAIFLGKNYLEQKDKQEVEHSGDISFRINGIDKV